MSYSPRHAQTERDQEVTEALQTRDSGALYRLAGLYKEEGEDEYAETLIMAAKKIDREDWAYDEAKDEGLLG
jgi:hypothetical protein